jgi:N-glycosylase/DNA lyase
MGEGVHIGQWTCSRVSSEEGGVRDRVAELLIPVGEFDLEETLESGQCFRWRRVGEGEYLGVLERCALHVRQVRPAGDRAGGALAVRVVGGSVPDDLEALVVRYFDLACDYAAIVRELRRDRNFARVVPRRAGIHILQQDPFEVIISFIISANNHIPRIRRILERLCALYGEEIQTPFGSVYSFPRPEILADARGDDLRQWCGVGYRDAYVRTTARALAACSDFAQWSTWPTPVVRRRLLELEGVGEKVADCILLFGFHRLEAFPVDTWILRAMRELYFPDRMPRVREVQACAAERFGAYAGVAQQYLYAAFRSGRGLRVGYPTRP